MIAKHTSTHTLIILNPNNMELGRLLNYAQLDEAIVTKMGANMHTKKCKYLTVCIQNIVKSH